VVAAEPGADDFAVVVDGARVSADVYALVRDPMEVVLVMDTSGSMAGAPIEQAKAAALGFAARLPESAHLAVVGFGDTANTLAPMGSARDEVTAAISGLTARGETALYDAVVEASGLFSGSDARRVVVLLSDGGDTASRADLDTAVGAVADTGAELRAVALETPESAPGALQVLSAGKVTTAADAAALAAAYEAVALELTGRYRLTFTTGATGVVAIDIFVNGPDGVLSASSQLDLTTGSSTAGVTHATPPEGFGPVEAPAPVTVIAAPDRFAEKWTLPAGIVLVFVGALVTLWLSMRGDKDAEPAFVPAEALVPIPEDPPGWLARVGRRALSVGDSLASRGRAGAIDTALDRAGLAIRPGEFVVVAATGVVVGVTTGLVVAGLPGAVLLGGVAAVLPRTVLGMRAARRRRAFADQLEGTLQTIAGSLRAGYGLVQAISTVAQESPAPTSVEFNRVVVENRLGRSLEDSLKAMVRRLDDEDFGWVVEAIEIQREVGGNLAEVLDTVTGTIRDRNMIRRQIRALSAEGRMSAYILLGLPFVIAGFIASISPDYLAELTGTTVGKVMLAGAGVLMFFGGLWIRKIVRVEF
jgi:tight adherence protein B